MNATIPFTFQDIDCQPSCIDEEYTIIDKDLLAEWVARLALGQSRHMANIIHQLSSVPINVTTLTKKSVLNRLQVPKEIKKDENKEKVFIEKRDGWLFQFISWIVVFIQNQGKLFKQYVPHTQPAMHGIDGLAVIVESGHIARIIITEDKCTKNARDTITKKIFPELDDYENGIKNTELLEKVGVLLDIIGEDCPDVHNEIENISKWQYRISITRQSENDSPDERKSLFKDYESHVKKSVERRRGSTTNLGDVRVWMEDFSKMVINIIKNKYV